MKYSLLKIIKEGITGNKSWRPIWRDPKPKKSYDIVIIGGGNIGYSLAQKIENNTDNIATNLIEYNTGDILFKDLSINLIWLGNDSFKLLISTCND